MIMGAGAGSVAGWRVALGAPMARIHEPRCDERAVRRIDELLAATESDQLFD